MHTKVIELKEYSNDKVSLLTQAVLTELLIIFGINSLVDNVFFFVFYAIIIMLMVNMSYNNYKFYKKKYMTLVYIIVGIFVLVTTLLEYLG